MVVTGLHCFWKNSPNKPFLFLRLLQLASRFPIKKAPDAARPTLLQERHLSICFIQLSTNLNKCNNQHEVQSALFLKFSIRTKRQRTFLFFFQIFRMELFGERRDKLLSKLIPGSAQLYSENFLFYIPGIEAYGESAVFCGSTVLVTLVSGSQLF